MSNPPFVGNVKTRSDAKGQVTTMAYDAQDRLVSTFDRLGGVTLNNFNCCQSVPNVHVVLLNPFNLQDFQQDKLSILDVKATDRNAVFYDIEIQKAGRPR